MSGGKVTSISHRALDELVKFKTSIITDIGQFKTDVLKGINDIVKAVSEVQAKHNDLAAHIVAVEGIAKNTAAFSASEIGKIGGASQRHFNDLDRSVNAVDLNVLALAELAKEIIGQLTQIDVLFTRLHSATGILLAGSVAGLDDSLPSGCVKPITPDDVLEFRKALEISGVEVTEIKTNAEKWYGDLVASAFKTVRERMEAEDAARRAKEAALAQEAKEAAEKTAVNEAEEAAVAAEIQKANADDLAIASSVSGGSGSQFPEGAEIFGG